MENMMTARIYRPSRSAMQSGKGKSGDWLLQFEAAPKSADPLMGWTSTADTQQQVSLRFETREEAIAYATREGIPYVIAVEPPVRLHKKSYSDNFRWGRSENWTH
jgi:ETC complex I subunit conserved region